MPRLTGVLETVLYCSAGEMEDTRSFYEAVLGLRPMWDGASMYRVAPGSVLLIFDRDEVVDQDSPPAHGTTGRGHMCFLCPPEEYEAWKGRLLEREIEIIDELTWRDDLRSFYFHDPAGNVLEIAEADMWPA